MPAEQRFLTLADVAEVLNVTVRQVYALVRSGELRGIQIGGRGQWRVEHDQLEAYIQRQYARADEALAELDETLDPVAGGPEPRTPAGSDDDVNA